MFINIGTGCGFTPKYEFIERKYNIYNNKGLEIIDIPYNQFGNQILDNGKEIYEFWKLQFNITFL